MPGKQAGRDQLDAVPTQLDVFASQVWPVGQDAAIAAFTDPVCEEYVQEMVASYDKRRKLIVNGLNELGMDCFEPKGAFYAQFI